MESLFRCCLCRRSYLYIPGEQQLFLLRSGSAVNEDCDNCAVLMKSARPVLDNSVSVKCKQCGLENRVPFQKNEPSEVFCSKCSVAFSQKLNAFSAL